MSIKRLDWSMYKGVDEKLSGDQIVDTGGVSVALGVTSGEDVSTISLTFSATDLRFSDEVKNLCFRINGLKLGRGGESYPHVAVVRAYGKTGAPKPVGLTPAGGSDASVLVEIRGPVSRIEIDHEHMISDIHADWLTGLMFEVIDINDSSNSTANGDNLIKAFYNSERSRKVIKRRDSAVVPLQPARVENLVPCFTPGIAIATPRGERRIEELQVGDRVITRDNGLQEIRWIGRRELSKQELQQAPHLNPVLVQAGSLGQGLPERDLLVSPQHRFLIYSERAAQYFDEREVLAAARHLTGLDGVDVVECSSVTYIHFMFDQHEVVLSNGSWTESFQPDEQVLNGMGEDQRDEIFDLYPELRRKEGQDAYQTARRSLEQHEARMVAK